MSSEKMSESTQSTVQQPDQKCSKNYKPWIWTLVAMAVFTIVWALYEGSQQEGYVNNFLTKGQNAKNTGVPGGLQVAGSPYAIQAAQAPGAVGDVQTSYHSIIDAVRPAVVSIDAAMKNVPMAANQGMVDQLPADVAFNKIGSGVIIDPRGYVLSSYHVIAGAEALKVTVYGPGGAMEYPLKMVKGDLRTDMALLRIQGNGPFAHATLGDSDAARTGDMVLTIGSPFGFEQSVSSGMISSRNRTLQVGDTVYENLIQTDSSINRGSSGGPMINVRGEVIGINTAIYAPTGVFNGIGFAIPVNRAADLVGGVVDFNNTATGAVNGQLVAWTNQGRQVGNAFRLPGGQMITAPHGQLGKCLDCHPQMGEPAGAAVAYMPETNTFRLPNGTVITPPHTPRGNCLNCHPQIVQQGGVQINADPFLMQQKGGVQINTDPFLMQQNNPGVAVNVDPLLQQQNGLGLHIGAGAGRGRGLFGRTNGGPMTGNGQFTAAGQQATFNEPLIGVALVDVDDIICRQAGMLHPEGVLVTSVVQGGPASVAGIQRGDILLRISGRKILNGAVFSTLLSSPNLGRTFELIFMRNGTRHGVRVKTGITRQMKQQGAAPQVAGAYQWPLGASITPLLPAVTAITKTGVYVQKSSGILAANGLKSGDIIKALNGAQVENLEDFIKQANRVNIKSGFVLDVIRSGNSIFLTVKG